MVLRLGRLDPLRILVSLAILGSVVALALTRAGNVQRGIGFSVAIFLAVGALFGLVALGQQVSLVQWGGMLAVVAASIGATTTKR